MKATQKTILALLQEATQSLELCRIPSSRLEAEVLLAHVLKCTRLDLYKNFEQKISESQKSAYSRILERRKQGIPTAYLRGEKEFYSLDFSVGPGVLIPRAETETLVEAGLAHLVNKIRPLLLDLGTGSGAILISLLVHSCGARGIGTDISTQALQYAEQNAEKHGVANRVTFLKGDLFAGLENHSAFDLILSNPPYIPTAEIPDELKFEPKEALDGGEDGFSFYQKILESAWKFLKPDALLILETGNCRPDELRKRLQEFLPLYFEQRLRQWKTECLTTSQPSEIQAGREIGQLYKPPEFRKDLSGKERALILQRK